MQKHMAWSAVGEAFVVVHDEEPPSDSDWRVWLGEYGASIAAGNTRVLVVFSSGGAPTTAQRKELLAFLHQTKKPPATVMITSSAVARGVITAVGWFIREEHRARAFRPDEEESAYTFLSLDAATRVNVRATRERLRATLDA
ncbi:MAG TPA: hypothetical protein VHV30_16170 [Polyangiaceae bacterium]|jgi:hypothetical protein|nr:hypothetical protein [Polyangiaceae bacterium]